MASFWHEFENGMRNGESQAMKEEEERVVDRSWFAKPQSEAGLGDSASNFFGGLTGQAAGEKSQQGGASVPSRGGEVGVQKDEGGSVKREKVQGVMGLLEQVVDAIRFVAEIPLDAARGLDGGMRATIGHRPQKTFSVSESAPEPGEESTVREGEPSLFRSVKGLPVEGNATANWNWDHVAPDRA